MDTTLGEEDEFGLFECYFHWDGSPVSLPADGGLHGLRGVFMAGIELAKGVAGQAARVFELCAATPNCWCDNTTADGGMVVAVLDVGFVNFAVSFPGTVRQDQARAALGLLFDFLVLRFGPATPQLASWRSSALRHRDSGVSDTASLTVPLRAACSSWFRLHSHSDDTHGVRFAAGELGLGDMAFPFVIPSFVPSARVAAELTDVVDELEALPASSTNQAPDGARSHLVVGSCMYHAGLRVVNHMCQADGVAAHAWLRHSGLVVGRAAAVATTTRVSRLFVVVDDDGRRLRPSQCCGLRASGSQVPHKDLVQSRVIVAAVRNQTVLVLMFQGREMDYDGGQLDPFGLEEVEASLDALETHSVLHTLSHEMQTRMPAVVGDIGDVPPSLQTLPGTMSLDEEAAASQADSVEAPRPQLTKGKRNVLLSYLAFSGVTCAVLSSATGTLTHKDGASDDTGAHEGTTPAAWSYHVRRDFQAAVLDLRSVLTAQAAAAAAASEAQQTATSAKTASQAPARAAKEANAAFGATDFDPMSGSDDEGGSGGGGATAAAASGSAVGQVAEIGSATPFVSHPLHALEATPVFEAGHKFLRRIGDRVLQYWIVGRLMGAGREFYVAFDPTVAESDDTDPQDVLEMGCRILFGLD